MFQSSPRAGVERRLCTQFQGAKFFSIRIALLLGRSRAAKHRTSESNRSDFAQTQSTCQPIGELTPSPTVSTPRFSPGCAAGATIGHKSGISNAVGNFLAYPGSAARFPASAAAEGHGKFIAGLAAAGRQVMRVGWLMTVQEIRGKQPSGSHDPLCACAREIELTEAPSRRMKLSTRSFRLLRPPTPSKRTQPRAAFWRAQR